MADDVLLKGSVRRSSEENNVESATVGAIFDRGSALHVRVQDAITRADKGQYFTLTTTPGTGIAGHAAPTTLDDTKPYVWLMSNYTASDGKRVYLDYLRTWVTAAGTNGTNLRFGIKLDSATTRRSSGGTAMTANGVSLQSSTAPSVTAYQGAVVAAAATNAQRLVTHGLIRTVINVIGDEYLFTFGQGQQVPAGMVLEGTAQVARHFRCPPIVLGPTDQFLFHFFSGSQSAASSHEVEIGFWVA
jgi:hypothetical protein